MAGLPDEGLCGDLAPQEGVELHPLKIPVILSELTTFVPRNSLGSFRLVSKAWLDASRQKWQSVATVTLDALEREDDALNAAEKFNEFARTSGGMATGQFKLCNWDLRCEAMMELGRVGSTLVTTLELHSCRFGNPTVCQQALFTWFPNLQKLTLKECSFPGNGPPVQDEMESGAPQADSRRMMEFLELDVNQQHLPLSWHCLMRNFGSIKSLKIYNFANDESLFEMLRAIQVIRSEDATLLRISSLDLLTGSARFAQEVFSFEACRLLCESKLPLRSLRIDFGVHTKESSVRGILENHVTTLRHLYAYRGPISLPYREFPIAAKLQVLAELTLSDRLTSSLSFLKYLPNLRKLTVKDEEDDFPPVSFHLVTNMDPLGMQDIVLEKCKNLEFGYLISVGDTNVLISLFPKLQTLKMPLTGDQFVLICQGWKQLVDLQIVSGTINDSILTGICEADLEVLQSVGSADHAIVLNANVTHLPGLRRFKMTNDVFSPTLLMDASAWHGFLKLAHLSSLHITSNMQNSTRMVLQEKVEDCTVLSLAPMEVGHDDDDQW